MKQRSLKKVCLFLLAGAMILTVFPCSGNVVYAQTPEHMNDNSETNVSTEEIEHQETPKALTQSLSDNNTQEISNSIIDTNGIIEVPTEGMIITGGVYYGISKDWYAQNNPDGKVLSLALTIPNNVTTIYNDGFRDSWSSQKQSQKCITNYNYDGDKTYTDKYTVVDIDFSNAANLTTINSQAAMSCTSLTGVLDLSYTKLETLGKSAFNGCTGLSGVIFPETLKNIGSTDSGSVFNGCMGLQFVRTTNGNSGTIFELPKNLEVIGRQSFKGCTGFPANTTVSIPASVTFVGSEAFYNSPNITTIFVQTGNANTYDGGAFKGDDYGLGKRLTVFSNFSAKKSFKPSGSNAYSNSLTYEFMLYYDTVKTEKKLWGQAVNVCKGQDGNWYTDENYVIPETDGNVLVGYTGGWIYDDTVLTDKTILKPSGDELTLSASYVLQEPTIQFIVDGKVIETEDTYPKLNLSNAKEHTIGVDVSHPIESVENADVKVKFEYEWTDVWNGGKLGPRMEEEGFGRYNLWDNPEVTNTITVNGAEHERTNTGNYSKENYGDGYYLLEIYGYSCPKSGGQWELFYKSAHTKIGVADPDRTTDTAYLFDVVTSEPVQKPSVTFTGNNVEYGYNKAEIVASVSEIDGQTNTYQWYKANKENLSSKGKKIDGATSTSLQIEKGKDAGEYYYYLEVTSKKELNGDVVKTNFPVPFTVNKIQSNIEITTKNMDKTYDGKVVSKPAVEKTGSGNAVVFTWYVKDGENWNKLDTAPINAGSYKVVASVAEDTNYNGAEAEKIFEITKAVPQIPVLETFIIKQGEALSSIELPSCFAWTDDTQKADELGKQTFKAIYTPEDTANYQSVEVKIAVNVVPAFIPVNQIPMITAEDKKLTVGDSFDVMAGVTALDKEDGDITKDIEVIKNEVKTDTAGAYEVTYKVTDKDGASTTKTITVTVKDKEEQSTTPTKPDTAVKTGDSTNVLLWSIVAVIFLAGVITVLLFKRRKSR
ncbi:leucine-rich repeat protein [Faecalicatena acetigenes]|uniref:Leucine-rich repeat protein n=1 Tax=Faecalicatena acetigenes TaxID=2981790 RepID=A0ABT2TG68_9FIRM|nr:MULTISPECIES: leucine-rich repeat protein [Lachnospiraceae]MCU6748796.1 leucine-rich repeat protein [Faecalicatena acetigenes]SCI66000.1 Uncharacterised protein [uncultured Clostridium sp.]